MIRQDLETLSKYCEAVRLYVKTGSSYHRNELMKQMSKAEEVIRKQIPPIERNVNNTQEAIDWSK